MISKLIIKSLLYYKDHKTVFKIYYLLHNILPEFVTKILPNRKLGGGHLQRWVRARKTDNLDKVDQGFVHHIKY